MISPLDRPSSIPNLRRLLSAGDISEAECRELEAQTRSHLNWNKLIDRWLLGLAVLLALAGVVDFFAHNWQRLGDMMKLGLAGGITLLCVALAIFFGFGKLSGKLWLFAACTCVGVFLAVFGQVYQTNTNTAEYFILWAALITPWTVLARFVPLWLGWMLLLNLAVYNLFDTRLLFPFFDDPDRMRTEQLSAVSLNIVFLALREVLAWRRVTWLDRGWSALVLLSLICGLATWSTCTEILVSDSTASYALASVAIFSVLTGVVYWFYIKVRASLPALALATLATCTVLTVGAIRLIFSDHPDHDIAGAFLFMGILILGIYGGGVFLLVQVSKYFAKK